MVTHRSDLVGVMIRPRDGCNEVKPAASSNNPGRFCPLEPLMGANWAKWGPCASGANFLTSAWVGVLNGDVPPPLSTMVHQDT